MYSWEQIKELAASFLAHLFKRHRTARDYASIDGLIGTILIAATLPITLAYWIMDQGLGADKLLIIIIELIFTGLLLGFLELLDNPRFHPHTRSIAGLLAGLLSRPFSLFLRSGHDRKIIARLAMAACLPLAFAGIIKAATREASIDFSSYLNQLTYVATLGLLLLISIEILEKLFRTRQLRLSAYLRVALGIVLIAILAGPK
ncbi:MAG: hypothetical protein A3B77_03495 [Candidatus Doudnabacteria bacterium RIFCSPHIGHO2_02_FULL_49_24]|nr:MAG: hypothetical protein A3B77_03495 [Candidatus Doudnabacteria bacterium RIFCSPHIGHO2_02_FULL_49_24]